MSTGINWDVVQKLSQHKAKQYADSKKYKDPGVEAVCYNAYLQGYMECAGERESLRVINEELRKALEQGVLKVITPQPLIEELNNIKPCAGITKLPGHEMLVQMWNDSALESESTSALDGLI